MNVKKEKIMILDILKVILMSLVEGLTEFIPVSSTGHMIIVEQFLRLSENKQFVNAFEIIIQLGATLLKVVKMGSGLSGYEWFLIALGFVLSFIFAYGVIRIFMNYIKKHDFKIFGYYRIIVGILILILFLTGVVK